MKRGIIPMAISCALAMGCAHDEEKSRIDNASRKTATSLQSGTQPYITNGIMVLGTNNWFLGSHDGLSATLEDGQVVYLQDEAVDDDSARNISNPFYQSQTNESDLSQPEGSVKETPRSVTGIDSSAVTPFIQKQTLVSTDSAQHVGVSNKTLVDTAYLVPVASNEGVKDKNEQKQQVKEIPEITFTSTINYALGVTSLSAWDSDYLRNAVSGFGASHDITRIEIIGYTDSTGNEALNNKIAKLRASKAANAVTTIFPGISIIHDGHGSCCYVDSNETRVGRSKNRRVDIILHGRKKNNTQMAAIKND